MASTDMTVDDSLAASKSAAPVQVAEGASKTTTAQEDVEGSNDGASRTAPMDPLSAISSIWSGWVGSTSSPASKESGNAGSNLDGGERSRNANGESVTSAAAAVASDFLQGAGKVWSDISSTIKDAAGSVDTGALGEQVTVIKQKSGHLIEDLSRSVQSLNISLPTTDLSRSAEAISSSTRSLLEKSSQSLEQGRREVLETIVDEDTEQSSSNNKPASTESTEDEIGNLNGGTAPTEKCLAPWEPDALPEEERRYADTLRREITKLVVDAIYSRKKRDALFLSHEAHEKGFEFDMNKRAGEAFAILEADKNMRRFRAGLVPGKMKEEEFWRAYFFHFDRIRQTLVDNDGVMPEPAVDEDEDD